MIIRLHSTIAFIAIIFLFDNSNKGPSQNVHSEIRSKRTKNSARTKRFTHFEQKKFDPIRSFSFRRKKKLFSEQIF